MVLATLTSYNIRNPLGYFIMDNAMTNDTLMDYISAHLESEGISYDPWHHRLRCKGHIINLAVCAFSFEKHSDAETQAKQSWDTWIGAFIQELDAWRKLSPLGKLYNIIVYIIGST